ncbi:MAG: ATPase domain-containing protein [Candidatus Aenigmatarchaeota archaeon]
MSKVTTGIPKLDKILGGGFPEKTTILLSGGPGTGKTLFGMNFLLEGARKGEKVCYVTLNETADELIRACKGFERMKDVEKFLGKNLAIEHIAMGESNISLKRFVSLLSEYPKIDRMVIDNTNKMLMFADTKRGYRIHFSEMLKYLKGIGCSLIICEAKNDSIDSGNDESFECDGIVQLSFMELEEKPMRSLTIHKLRYSSFDAKVSHEFIIDSYGLKLGEVKVI